MKKILAVSGGVDSMVMLEIFLEKFPAEELVVATFNHRTRESSGEDAGFVERKFSEVSSALKIRGKVRFYRGEASTEGRKSEEKARAERYRFLREIAFREKGEIYTAHHLDDLVESVTINLIRGTGIRGLAPMTGLGIRRPFLDGTLELFDKRKILQYAAEHGVTFRQDPTNSSEEYLRNRVREKTFDLAIETKLEIYELWKKQKGDVREIEAIIEAILPEDLRFEREWFEEMDEGVKIEILRGGLERAGVKATRPQMAEFAEAIKTYQPGKQFNLPGDKLVRMNKKDFML